MVRIKPRQRCHLSVGLLTLLLLVGACGTRSTPVKPTNSQTLKMLFWQAPTILNPHLAQAFKDLDTARITYEPLASFNANDELVPILAQAIPSITAGTLAQDGTSVTWTLKPNLQWSDGMPVTAEDVKFTFEFVSTPETGASTLASYAKIERVEVLDQQRVTIHFQSPTPAWFDPFVGRTGMILPRHLFQGYSGVKAREAPANLRPVGTGPYRVIDFKPGDRVVFEKNPFFRQAVAFERVEIKGGGDATSAARAVLQTGDVDYAHKLELEASILKTMSQDAQGEAVSIWGPKVLRVQINFSDPNRATATGERSSLQFPHPFFSDLKVRQAFAHAIDRDTIAEQLYQSLGQPAVNLLVRPQSLRSPNNDQRYPYNVAIARQLLTEAGWQDRNQNGIRDKDGQEMNVVFQASTHPIGSKIQAIIKQSLSDIGVAVELKSIEPSVFLGSDPSNTDNAGHFYADLQMYSAGNLSPDPTAYLKWFTCDEIPQQANGWSKFNDARYCNPQYDRLWQQVSQELTPQKRTKLFQQMNDLLIRDVATIPLINQAQAAGISQRLQGVALTPWDADTWQIGDWYF